MSFIRGRIARYSSNRTILKNRAPAAGIAALFLAVAVPLSVAAQRSPVSIEARAGLAFPSGALSSGQRDLAADLGFAVGMTALIEMGPELSLYGGWSRHGFGCPANFGCDVDGDFTSHGYEVGVEYILPHQTVMAPWLRAGATLHRFRYRAGTFETETDPAAGFEIGGGVHIPLRDRLTLVPSLRFARYVASLNLNTFQSAGEPFTVTRILAEVGARFGF